MDKTHTRCRETFHWSQEEFSLWPQMRNQRLTKWGRDQVPLSYYNISPKWAFGNLWVSASYSHHGVFSILSWPGSCAGFLPLPRLLLLSIPVFPKSSLSLCSLCWVFLWCALSVGRMVRTAVPPSLAIAEVPQRSPFPTTCRPFDPSVLLRTTVVPSSNEHRLRPAAAQPASQSPWQPAFPLFYCEEKMAVMRKGSLSLLPGCFVQAPPSYWLDEATCIEPNVH